MQKFITFSFYFSVISCICAILLILSTYFYLKPNLPEISLVDESELQLPLKIYTEDEVLIGEFGEIKRSPISYADIPYNLKHAFLAAEDDNFFNHQGISYTGLLRAFIQYVEAGEIVSGGGTITMQVVRGFLLTREQKLVRKIKEIYLALELEGNASKEEIFELYVNRIFLGNRSYGVNAAAGSYFGKSIDELTLAESATIAAMAQLPSKINAIKSPRRTKQRRDWILYRMNKLRYITDDMYQAAIFEPITVRENINMYEVSGSYIAELARQEVISRYGLRAYTEGWSVYTTVNSRHQKSAIESVQNELFAYDKRHGWRSKDNFIDIFNEIQIFNLKNFDNSFLLKETNYDYLYQDESSLSFKLNQVFDNKVSYPGYEKAIVLMVQEDKLLTISQSFELLTISWSDEYKWARPQENINRLGKAPDGFVDFIFEGDFIYLKKFDNFYMLDQIPIVESALISMSPESGAVKAYIGGFDFNRSNFDRVRQSYPQTGSSFKPFLYASALESGYNLSTLINDAPIAFEDKNLESVWRPENYTGEFYGLMPLREALNKSVNIVSIKLLRELGINNAQNGIDKFGLDKKRLPRDLSLALGSGNFSPAEMLRAYSVFVNNGSVREPYYVNYIRDRFGNIIYKYEKPDEEESIVAEFNAFPWLNTIELEANRPYSLIKPNKNQDQIDPRVAYLMRNNLIDFLSRGSAGRKSSYLNRDDIGGKTGTTNDSISTWFSGFQDELVTTVWVGTDDFTSLGENEYGSTISLPIWLGYMEDALQDIPIKNIDMPEGISFVRINKDTGLIDANSKNSYFELILSENIEN